MKILIVVVSLLLLAGWVTLIWSAWWILCGVAPIAASLIVGLLMPVQSAERRYSFLMLCNTLGFIGAGVAVYGISQFPLLAPLAARFLALVAGVTLFVCLVLLRPKRPESSNVQSQ